MAPDTAAATDNEQPVSVMRGLAGLIPCSSITFCLDDPCRFEEPLALDGYDVREVEPDDENSRALCNRAHPEFAPCRHPEQVRGPGVASMRQDYFGDRAFERTWMAQYYRLGGLRHHLIVLLPATDGLRRKVILWRDEGDIPFERLESAGGVDPRAAQQVGLQRGQPAGRALPAGERLRRRSQPSIDTGVAGLPSSGRQLPDAGAKLVPHVEAREWHAGPDRCPKTAFRPGREPADLH